MTLEQHVATVICEIECSGSVPTPNEGHYLTVRKVIEVVRGAIADEIEARMPYDPDPDVIVQLCAAVARGFVSPPLAGDRQ